MKILFISIAWPADGHSNLYTDLMEEFVIHGHEVKVVGTQDSDPLKRAEKKKENGITVLRIYSGRIRKTSHLKKICSLFALGGRMKRAIITYYGQEHIDLVIGATPPITLSKLYRYLKMKFNAPFYLLLKDIWPQGSVDLGVIRQYGLPWLYLRSHEMRLYKVADYIGCMSPRGAEYIVLKNKFISPDKVEVCPNSIRPSEQINRSGSKEIRNKYNIPEDACVFIFSGNLGMGHGLHFMVDAIKALSGYPKAYFIIGGAGTHYRYLKDRFDEFSPKNAFLYNWLPREDFEQILNTSDVGLIFLYRYTSPQFPSRLLSYFDYSKPVLCAINPETDMGTIVEEWECGKAVLHGDMEGFTSAVKFFSENEPVRKKMGENGRKLLMSEYTVNHSYNIIMNHFK